MYYKNAFLVTGFCLVVASCSTNPSNNDNQEAASNGIKDDLYYLESSSGNNEDSSSDDNYENITVDFATENETSSSLNNIMQDENFDSTLSDLSEEEIETIKQNQLILFKFDSNDIQEQFLSKLKAQLNVLETNPNLRVMLEGRADERGTREYNVLLSERRAIAVKKFLVEQGANPKQILYVGLGENEPLFVSEKSKLGQDKWWSYNRSVYFKFIEK